jgi:hypothetical protein
MEYGTECYCGNSYVGGAPAIAPSTDCKSELRGRCGRVLIHSRQRGVRWRLHGDVRGRMAAHHLRQELDVHAAGWMVRRGMCCRPVRSHPAGIFDHLHHQHAGELCFDLRVYVCGAAEHLETFL